MNSRRNPLQDATIRIARDDRAIRDTFAVMRQLRPSLRRSTYVRLVKLQRKEVRFQLAALKKTGRVVAVAGFRLCRSLGWGKYLYIDDLVTDSPHRSGRFGTVLLHWLVDFARRHGCVEVRLDSALYRHGAHRFYLRERFDIACFHFRLPLVTHDLKDIEHEIAPLIGDLPDAETPSVPPRRATELPRGPMR